MSLFSKLSGKGSQSSAEKPIYPWSQPSATSTGGDAPSARCYHSIVSIGNQLVVLVFGGQLKSPADQGDSTVYSLNIQTRQWTRNLGDSADPIPRQAHAAAASGNQMYIHGGHTVNGQVLGDMLIFMLVQAGNMLPTK
ncbi:hypothetical protein BGW37DRAFT_523220 [Umbelopsis sp. PMI_123]|nr:hypothetical protein BGW37DRAFT_545793 [Umbelopsis sp. PMI_123]KAH8548449.1 hypothetical protein BGW37DRAFT_523220 [Umbelopsis sp. PMI_123]